MFKQLLTATITAAALAFANPLLADSYLIDTKNAHAFVQFKISHLGYSWLLGRFNEFSGSFEYDEKAPGNASISVTIDTASLDSNNAERDKHLRSDDFLDVEKFPTASFSSTAYQPKADGSALLTGDLTLHGVTRQINIETREVGAGNDPWGGFRRGFEGSTSLRLKDYGIDYDLGPAAETVQLYFSFEGIRQ